MLFFVAKTSRISPFPIVLHEVSFPSGHALRCPICNPLHPPSLDSFFVSNWICILFYPRGSRTLVLTSSYDPNVSMIMLSCPRPISRWHTCNLADRCVETMIDVERQSLTYHLDPVIRFIRRTRLYRWQGYLSSYLLVELINGRFEYASFQNPHLLENTGCLQKQSASAGSRTRS